MELFREQGIMIASIFRAIGMAISVLVEALLPGSGGAAAGAADKGGGNMKELHRNRLKALASLLGRKWQKLCLSSLGQSSAGSSIG